MTFGMKSRFISMFTCTLMALLMTVELSGCSSKEDEAQSRVNDNSTNRKLAVQKQKKDVEDPYVIKNYTAENIEATSTNHALADEQIPGRTEKVITPSEETNGAEQKLEYIMKLLAEQGHDSARVKIAEVALKNPRPDVRQTAIKMLADCQSPNLLGTLKRALNDENEAVRLAAVEVLKSSKNIEKNKLLEQAMGDPSREVRLAAAKAVRP